MRLRAFTARGRSTLFLIFHSPLTWKTTSLESMYTSRSVTPLSRANSRPAISALYSATLFVVTPIASAISPMTSPESSLRITPMPAGPGFPRAPASVKRVPFTTRCSDDHEDATTVVASLQPTFGPHALDLLLRELRVASLTRALLERGGPHTMLL